MFGLEWQLTWFELVCSTMFSIILASLSMKSQCYSISQIQLTLILLLNTGGPQLTENHVRHEQFDSCRQSVPIKTQNTVKRSALILCKLSKEKPASQFPSLGQLPMKYDWQDFPCKCHFFLLTLFHNCWALRYLWQKIEKQIRTQCKQKSPHIPPWVLTHFNTQKNTSPLPPQEKQQQSALKWAKVEKNRNPHNPTTTTNSHIPNKLLLKEIHTSFNLWMLFLEALKWKCT